ncbi:Hypothetical protein FKW44_014627, partial [Caligus rogercresseyi]
VLVHFFKACEKINIDVYLGVLKKLFSLGWTNRPLGRLQREGTSSSRTLARPQAKKTQ